MCVCVSAALPCLNYIHWSPPLRCTHCVKRHLYTRKETYIHMKKDLQKRKKDMRICANSQCLHHIYTRICRWDTQIVSKETYISEKRNTHVWKETLKEMWFLHMICFEWIVDWNDIQIICFERIIDWDDIGMIRPDLQRDRICMKRDV